MNSDIYISSSRRDFEVVSKIKSILHSAGYTYFDDRQSFQPASDFEQTTRAEIISSKVFLCILSGNSSSSAYVREELRLALKEKKTIIPIVIDNAEIPVEIERLRMFPIRLNLNDIASAKPILLQEIGKEIENKVLDNSSFVPKNTDKNLSQIFISYKRDDLDMVWSIKDIIEKHTGENCWIDLDGIESDAQFANVIIKAINQAKVFLFMYSSKHTEIEDYENDWTIREINFAQKKKKRIVFVNIDGSKLTDWFELIFGTKQQINAKSSKAMKKLCSDIQKWLSV